MLHVDVLRHLQSERALQGKFCLSTQVAVSGYIVTSVSWALAGNQFESTVDDETHRVCL